jgi:hypothetical protein
MASIDISIVLISLPAIFNGIHINPLAPGETNYFLWILLGYMVVTTTLLVTFGRIWGLARKSSWDSHMSRSCCFYIFLLLSCHKPENALY